MAAPTPTPKSDQLRLLREQAYARLASSNYEKLAKQEKLATARKVVVNSVINEPDDTPALLTSSAKRSAKWRSANIETNRERAREGMRKLREKAAT